MSVRESKRLVGCWLLLGLLLAQVSGRAQAPAPHSAAPTARAKATQAVAAQAVVAADTAAHDESYQLEVAYSTLSSLSGQLRRVYDAGEVAEELPGVVSILRAIDHSAAETGEVVDLKQRRMCQLMLASVQEQLADWRTGLATAHEQLEAMRARLKALPLPVAHRPPRAAAAQAQAQAQTQATAEPLAAPAQPLALLPADSALGRRRQRLGKLLTARFEQVKALQTQVATNYIQTLELQDQVSEQLRRLGSATLRAERPPLWAATEDAIPAATSAAAAEAVAGYQREIIAYYFAQNWDNWAYMVLIGLVFYGWVTFNYYRAETAALAAERGFRYLRPAPVAVTLVVVFSLAPALELHPPPVYLALLQALLLAALTAVFARSLPRGPFRYWLGLLVFFGALMLVNAHADAGRATRWRMLGLDALAVGTGAWLLRRVQRAVTLPRFISPVMGVFVGLNLLAIVANVFGRLSLAKLFSTAAIFGLTQGLGLAVFMAVFSEAFHLQILASRRTTGDAGGFDYARIARQLLRLLTGVAAALWGLVFLSNLNLYAPCYVLVARLLTAPRLLGSTEFTLGNILLFFLILYVSAQLQKYVGYFFGDVGEADRPEARKRGSWLVGLRLLLLLLGFALATAATGLPLSKIAIVFGALSIGIGLGLQSIVNNLVSGIILLFERPFHVGDFIEVAGKSGRVQDIGIRSSKLTSLMGSEIIVPNGDLLAGHVINWTRTNDHIRTELQLKLAPGDNPENALQTARELIGAEITASPYTMHALTPEILLSSINGQVYELKVLFWITNIRQEELTRSEILAGIYRRFTAQGLQLG